MRLCSCQNSLLALQLHLSCKARNLFTLGVFAFRQVVKEIVPVFNIVMDQIFILFNLLLFIHWLDIRFVEDLVFWS